jgi:hypothetical protein
MTLPVYIINFNRLTPLQGMVSYFRGIQEVEPIVVDNASTYPPLLRWYQACDIEVIRMQYNYGPRVVWETGFPVRGYYAVTDSDLDLSHCPLDVFDVLMKGFNTHQVIKSGVSLEIDDLPYDFELSDKTIEWESRFWKDKADPHFYHAGVDTTLALYHSKYPYNKRNWTDPAIRSDRPYTARHIPWYCSHKRLSEEDKYYLHSARRWSTWGSQIKRLMKQKLMLY